jgi:hypothetical protein
MANGLSIVTTSPCRIWWPIINTGFPCKKRTILKCLRLMFS